MKKFLILIFILCSLPGCDEYYTLTSNITSDQIYDFTQQHFGMKYCAIPAAIFQHNRPSQISPYYVPSKYGCVETSRGDVCGYDCKIAGHQVKCGTLPAQRCIVGSSDYIACGYDCKRTSREAKCGLRYGDTCVIAQSGQVICGLNCRIEGYSIKCDQSPDFRPIFVTGYWP